MSNHGVRYTDDFKKQLVDLYGSGQSVSYLSREYGAPKIQKVLDSKGIILHSDLGTQYTSKLFEDYILNRKMIHGSLNYLTPQAFEDKAKVVA